MSSSPKVDSFQPVEWYLLASWLFDTSPASSSECLRRTIIGRAYYAALICARNVTGSSTLGQDGHKNVVNALRRKNSRAAGKLDSLRITRHRADYTLDIHISRREVEICLKDTLTVLRELGLLPANMTSYQKPYSHDYLDSSKFLSK